MPAADFFDEVTAGHMLLKTTDAGTALNTDVRTVLHWIKHNHLPAEMVNGEYMINRADLLEWATGQGLKVDPSIFNLIDDDSVSLPTLSEALASGGIHDHVGGTDMETIFRQVVERLGLPDSVDPEFILDVLLTREAMGTTAIGHGIAIPHVRNPILLQMPVSKIALFFLDEPVDFNAPDGKKVNILFTLTSPTVKTHLHLLSGLSYALRDKRLRDELQRRPTHDRIMSLIRECEPDPLRMP